MTETPRVSLVPGEAAYVAAVHAALPPHFESGATLAGDIHEMIARQLLDGADSTTVLSLLGSPAEFAARWLSDCHLENPGWGNRISAKVFDFCLIAMATLFPVLLVMMAGIDPFLAGVEEDFAPTLPLVIYAVTVAMLYPTLSEWRFGRTLGKRLCGLAVVSETGARITLRQAVVRNLPGPLQAIWIDAIFAVFSGTRQRLFERLSMTRTVDVRRPR